MRQAAPPSPRHPARKTVTLATAAVLLVAGVGIAVRSAVAVVGGSWVAQGPGPIVNGQVEGIANGVVSGAIEAVAVHPTSPAVLYVGSVNGGIWRTTNATAVSPTWTPLTDGHPSLSIGALAFDPTDVTSQTLVAGVGRFSSFGRAGGARAGLLRTTDGSSWSDLADATIAGRNVAAVAPRGSTIVVAADRADVNSCVNIGILRSTNTGTTFAQVLAGVTFDLAGDPGNAATLYTALLFANPCGGLANGVYKSTTTGAAWTKVSSPAIDAFFHDTGSNATANVRIAVGSSNNVYVGIVDFDGSGNRLAAVFRSGDGGANWTSMSLPGTVELSGFVGIHPGGQGSVHFSIVADPANANRVYVGGDRQPLTNEPGGGFPNSIGAQNFTGRLFRGDASLAPANQWTHITHSHTSGGSAPHADSRHMAFDASGSLVEVDDGGVYRRTTPQSNTGDWLSVNGDLQVTELHDIAYDTVSNVVIGGAQDTGTPQQNTSGGTTWTDISQGDGGDVAVDPNSVLGQSIRYSAAEDMQAFRRQVYDAANVLQGETFPSLAVVGGGAALDPQFRTPVEVNRIDHDRLVIVGNNSIYESFDQGDTITEVGPGQGPNGDPNGSLQNAVAYGGRRLGIDNPDVLYVGITNQVLVRTVPGPLAPSAAYPGGPVRDVAMDPNDWMHAFVIDSDQVFGTTNAGASWTDVSGNLGILGAAGFRTVVYVPAVPNDMLVVGTNAGVYVSFSNDFTVWDQLGTGLPNALVYDLAYDGNDDVLLAGTLGRGAWELGSLGGSPPPTTTTTSSSTSTTTSTTLPSCPAVPSSCQAAAAQKAQLVLRDTVPDARDQVGWKWKSTLLVQKNDFGSPTTTTHYVLCVYDAGGLKLQAVAPAAQLCAGRACWKDLTKGFKYNDRDLTPDGLQKIGLTAGDPGKGRVVLKGRGDHLAMPALPLALPVRVQLAQSASSTCWEATYSAAVKNDATQFKAKSD